jgi:ATP-dependent 26S proteasome regulatory subunit
VYRVPFADLFSGAALLVPAPEREPPPAPTCRSPVRLLAPQEDNDDPEPEPVPLPSAPLLALTLPTVARAEPPPARSQPYEHPVEHLGELLELARAVAARAIARAWDRGTLRAPIPGARPGEAELEALSGEAAGSARADLASWAGRVRELEAATEGKVRATASAGDRLPLPELAAQLGLSETAVSVLVAVLAPALCPETARLYAVLADDPARPLCDRALVLELLGGHDWSERERVRAELAPDRPLVAHGAVQVGIPGPGGDLFTALSVNRAVLERLRGELTTSEPAGVTTLVRADGDLEALAIPRPILAQVLEALGRAGGEPPRIVVRGRPGMGRTTLLAAIAARAGRALAVIDAERLPEDDLAGALWRELVGASLRGAVACVSGLEERCRSEVGGVQSAAVRAVVGDFFEPIAFRAGAAGELPLEPGYLSVTLPTPSETERRARWRQATRRRGLRAEGLDDLARRYRCGPGTIERVVAEAGARPPEGDATGALEAAARRHVSCRLGPLATRVERLARLDQVALPPEIVDSIKELIARARHRRTVFETWGFGQVVTTARGLTALFSGPPGTGKTMVAGAIARELGLDLFRVDLARVVSKWIGETEKNLGRLFDAAEDGQAVILFDEADSLFSRRTQVKSSIDRHGNMEVNYLLQRIDAFEGVALLTTNQAGAIDAAFRRRLSLRLAFPYPDEETRVQLWRAHLPEGAPVAGDLDLAALARKFPLTGGTIRNSVLRAAFLAAAEERPLGQEHLLRAVHLEYSDTGKLAPGGRLE